MASEGEDVPHLMDQDQHDEAGRELPAPQQAVGRDRYQSGAGARQNLDLGREEQKRGNAEENAEVEAAIPSEIFRQRLTRLGWAVHKFDFNGRGAGWRLLVAIAPVAREPLAPLPAEGGWCGRM